MKDLKLLVTICLNIGLAFSRGISTQCRSVQGGICGRGQFVTYTEDSGYMCVDCPQDTFMDIESHACESCKDRTQPNSREKIIKHGSSTEDNVIVCNEGFFRAQGMSPGGRGECESCSICRIDTWAARKCSEYQDTFCCKHGMIAVQLDGVSLTCIVRDPVLPRQIQQMRLVRSSGSNENNLTEVNASNNTGTDNNSQGHQTSGEEENSSPDHGYSKADYESEYQHNKVEFPVWARILCAGVAVGVFLFYLGVGIPCNACGSRDKLRELRKRVFNQSVLVPTEEESKEKPSDTPKSNIDQV